MPRGVHEGIHAAGYNADWAEFLFGGQNLPGAEETQVFAEGMMHEYDLFRYLPFKIY